jgi:outer membrane immunogenic protein
VDLRLTHDAGGQGCVLFYGSGKKRGLAMCHQVKAYHQLKATLAAIGLSIGISGAALAADIAPQPVYKAPPPPPPPFSWTGFYLGVNIGGAWSTGTITDTVTGASLSGNNDGFIGGGQVGFNYQISNWVLGAEWDFDGTTLRRTSDAVSTAFGTLQASVNTDWISTLTGRVGLAVDRGFLVDRSLFYVKGGGAWVQNSATLTDITTGASASGSNTNDGWTVGGGWEWAFAPNWSTKIEYDFVRLDNWSPSNTILVDGAADRLRLSRDIDMVKVGVNYRFGWGSSY